MAHTADPCNLHSSTLVHAHQSAIQAILTTISLDPGFDLALIALAMKARP